MVEQPAVNRRVRGSSPLSGANSLSCFSQKMAVKTRYGKNRSGRRRHSCHIPRRSPGTVLRIRLNCPRVVGRERILPCSGYEIFSVQRRPAAD